MSRRKGPPGRETAAARSRVRRIWYGFGILARAEKNGPGVFLHDAIRVFGEVSVLSMPTLFLIAFSPATGVLDARMTGLVAWLTMTLAGTLIRGGWIRPLATPTLGWVRLSPSLLLLRLGYFNLALTTATFGSLAVGAVVAAAVPGIVPGLLAAVVWAGSVAAMSILVFPRVAGEWLALSR